MRSVPSPARHQKTTTVRSGGRHRAPARTGRAARARRPTKIIAVGAPLVLLAGAVAGYQALARQHPQPHVTGLASVNAPALRAGNAVTEGFGVAVVSPRTARHSGGRTVTADASSKSHAARARRHRAGTHTTTPTPAASPAAAQPVSTTGLKAAVQKDISSGNYLLAVAQYLVENGYPAAAAAGIASCIDGESGGNPESVGSGGGGLIGWTPLGSAMPNPDIVTGNVTQDMMAQLSDLLYYNSTEIGQSLVRQLDGISNPVSAADFFSLNFEKPAVTYSDVVPSVADQIYAELTG